jgi:ferredoxin--NADP+ reductase
MNDVSKYLVAVIGAGPAGIFAAKELTKNGAEVLLFNRDIKPGGLAEYGIYPDKLKMKEGLRKQFFSILETPEIHYFGNMLVGEQGDIRLNDMRELGVQAILVTTGAQGTKWQGLPGESLKGVYHAKDLVYHYNQLPPYSMKKFDIGRRVAVIGVGNVMADISRYLICERQVDVVYAVARRGPAEVKFTKKELEYIVENLDMENYRAEIERATPFMAAVGQDAQEPMRMVEQALENAEQTGSNTSFRMRFLASVRCILGNDSNQVCGLELENNTLMADGGSIRAKGLGNRFRLDVDTVIFAIGDAVDPGFGLPVDQNEFSKNPNPRFPIENISYEGYDPATQQGIPDIFLAGWARKTSSGLVGLARKDGIGAATAMVQYLSMIKTNKQIDMAAIHTEIMLRQPKAVNQAGLAILQAEENRIAIERGIPGFKFSTNAEMAAVIESNRILDYK